ncbi:Pex14 protein [Martiniozyma asiatica (nom. inval.)]|nr:Pex14 protein [Martiniozyma asiatica]
MSQQSRQELIDSALQFLADPQVSNQPLSSKLSFLESKGLTPEEIQVALAQAKGSTPTTVEQPMAPPLAGPLYSHSSPPLPTQPLPNAYDWKDYLIMTTTTAGFLYGAYHLVKKHILPSILPPNQNKLEEDKEAMEREFERVEAMLEKLEQDQTEFIEKQNEKSKAIDDAIVEVEALVKDTTDKNLRNEETLKYLKLEVESIKTTLLKSLDNQKQTISSELQGLHKMTGSIKSDIEELNAKSIPTTINKDVQKPSQTPPPNLLTNKSNDSTIGISPAVTPETSKKYSNLNIPSPSSVPSAKDILKDDFKTTEEPKNEKKVPTEAGIPAWQLASQNKQEQSIPAWQLAMNNQ